MKVLILTLLVVTGASAWAQKPEAKTPAKNEAETKNKQPLLPSFKNPKLTLTPTPEIETEYRFKSTKVETGVRPSQAVPKYQFQNIGQERGGGNLVMCLTFQKQIRSLTLFDYWENRILLAPGKLKLDFGPGETAREKIKFALDRFAKIDRERAMSYKAIAYHILNNLDVYLSNDENLPLLNDDESPVDPVPPCYKVRFVEQNHNPAPGERRFKFLRNLVESPHMTQETLAGIILHETIYFEAMARGQFNSDFVRNLNFLISSDYFTRFPSAEEHFQIMKDNGWDKPLTFQQQLKFWSSVATPL